MAFFAKDESYDIPSTSNYFKFEEGDNRFRILGSFAEGTAIRGMGYWTTVDGKRTPRRVKLGTPIPNQELEVNKFGELDRPKHFWCLPVYNYQEKKVQLLEINQKSILEYIKKQVENPKWGDPREYDLIVTRIEEKGKTSYVVSCDPKEEISQDIIDQYLAMNININALYTNDDPFASSPETVEEIDIDEVDKALSK